MGWGAHPIYAIPIFISITRGGAAGVAYLPEEGSCACGAQPVCEEYPGLVVYLPWCYFIFILISIVFPLLHLSKFYFSFYVPFYHISYFIQFLFYPDIVFICFGVKYFTMNPKGISQYHNPQWILKESHKPDSLSTNDFLSKSALRALIP